MIQIFNPYYRIDKCCLICGKHIYKPKYALHLHNYGNHIVRELEALCMNNLGNVGYFPVGAECLMRYPYLRHYAILYKSLDTEIKYMEESNEKTL